MASVSSRIAYVFLAAIEDEFRAIIDRHAGDEEPSSVLGDILMTTAMARRRRDGVTASPHTVGQLLSYLDFQDGYDLANRIRDSLPTELGAGLRGCKAQVEKTVAVRNRVAHNRPLDIDDLPTVVDLSNDLVRIAGWDWAKIRETQAEVKQDPGFIFRVSANLIVDPDTAVANNLPAPDFDETSLLGRKEERRQLLRALRGSWPVISVLGDGGIGKTALALQVCYDLVEQSDCPFEAVVWVSAKNSQLTSTEILRIESAVEDSLGLFASAVAELGGITESATVIDDLISVLESFPILLVLDNVETILDESFPRFLREIPTGSKVLITSRIGVKTENPYKIAGLSEADAIKLIRILARSRGLDLATIATADEVAVWVGKMNCHPAYIKWFVSGLQAGQMPEQLLNDNGLVLDFCMSNVFEYLTETAKGALRAMLVVPGAHTMAELAFLTELDSATIQEVILDLTRTNFVSQVRGGASGTALELSDFARDYLRRTLKINANERQGLTDKQKQLYALGGGLQAAHALNPYAAQTIDIRGVGDYSAAKLLRDALDLAARDMEGALQMCSEASGLAPGYHEAARVEAYLHETTTNFGEAYESYSRARDLAPEDSHVAYSFGKYLIDSGFDPSQGIRELQRAAKLDPESSLLHVTIASAFASIGDFRQAMDAAAYAISASPSRTEDQRNSLYHLWRTTSLHVRELAERRDWSQIAEDMEFSLTSCSDLDGDAFEIATKDHMLWVEHLAKVGASEAADDFIARRIHSLVRDIESLRVGTDASQSDRRVGVVDRLIQEKGYGFLEADGASRFFHARSLWGREKFDELVVGSVLIFELGSSPVSGKTEATSIHWVW